MMIAAAAAGASLLQDALSNRKPAATAQPERPEPGPSRHAGAEPGLSPAAAKLVAGAKSLLLGVQAGGG